MTSTMPRGGGRAVVIGASLAGLTSARVLADFFEEVCVLERDRLPTGPEHRRFVPQSFHAHGLLGGGRNALVKLFPGWLDDLRAHGAPVGPDQQELAEKSSYLLRGHGVIAAPSWWLGGVAASRVLIEHTLRERVRAMPNVRFVEQESALGLITTGPGAHERRVTSVQTTTGQVEADLVIDASGRASRLPRWLEELGYAPPRVTTIHSHVQYASCVLEAEPGFEPDWVTLIGGDASHGVHRGVVLMPIEHERYFCTFATVAGEQTLPSDPSSYLAWADDFQHRAVRDALVRMRVASPIRSYRVPSNRFVHYERLSARPRGVLALGDAVCAFNPIYGQGMSVAARSALALQGELARAGGTSRAEFELRASRAIAAIARPAWTLGVAEDLRLGCASDGLRGRALWRLGGPYQRRLERVATFDTEVALALNEVIHLVRSPSVLFSPRIVARVLRARPTRASTVPSTSPTRATRHLFEVPPLRHAFVAHTKEQTA